MPQPQPQTTVDSTADSIDSPLNDPQKDQFGYAPFARYVAQKIIQMPTVNGCVMAINAPWGTGKSTLLNFIENALGSPPNAAKRKCVVRFNPWLCSTQNDMMRLFFNQLAACMCSEKYNHAVKFVSDLCEVLSQSDSRAASMFSKAKEIGERDIHAIKSNLASTLRDGNSRFVVMVDDIDRLSADESKQLFGLIKVIGDLPNVIYLLAFDRGAVTRSLEGNVKSGSGEQYLDKIVQISLHLPVPDRRALGFLFLGELKTFLNQLNSSPSYVSNNMEDRDYSFKALAADPRFRLLLQQALVPMMETPRDVKRFMTGLSLTLERRIPSISAHDFIALEGLRLFSPDLYETVTKNKDHVAGGIASGDLQTIQAKAKEMVAARGEPEIFVLKHLFPKINAALMASDPIFAEDQNWAAYGMVADPGNLESYLKHMTTEPEMTRLEFDDLLKALAAPGDGFAKAFSALVAAHVRSGKTTATVFFDYLVRQPKALNPENSLTLMKALLTHGDAVWQVDPQNKEFDDILTLKTPEMSATHSCQIDNRFIDLLLSRINDVSHKELPEIDKCESANILATIVLQSLGSKLLKKRFANSCLRRLFALPPETLRRSDKVHKLLLSWRRFVEEPGSSEFEETMNNVHPKTLVKILWTASKVLSAEENRLFMSQLDRSLLEQIPSLDRSALNQEELAIVDKLPAFLHRKQ